MTESGSLMLKLVNSLNYHKVIRKNYKLLLGSQRAVYLKIKLRYHVKKFPWATKITCVYVYHTVRIVHCAVQLIYVNTLIN